MLRRRQRMPEAITGTGGLLVAGLAPENGGAGQVIQDARPQGFRARVVARVSGNSYRVVQVDSGLPATFPAANMDPEPALAYEVTLRTDVPTNALVWCEPLRGAAGYEFEYVTSSGSSGAIDAVSGSSPFTITPNDTWLDAGFTWSIPAVGKCLLTGSAKFLAKVSAIGGDAYVQSRVLNVTSGQIVSGSMSITSILNTGVFVMFAHKFAEFQNVVVPTTLRWEVYRSSGGTWTTCQAGPPNFTNGDAAVFTLNYVAP